MEYETGACLHKKRHMRVETVDRVADIKAEEGGFLVSFSHLLCLSDEGSSLVLRLECWNWLVALRHPLVQHQQRIVIVTTGQCCAILFPVRSSPSFQSSVSSPVSYVCYPAGSFSELIQLVSTFTGVLIQQILPRRLAIRIAYAKVAGSRKVHVCAERDVIRIIATLTRENASRPSEVQTAFDIRHSIVVLMLKLFVNKTIAVSHLAADRLPFCVVLLLEFRPFPGSLLFQAV